MATTPPASLPPLSIYPEGEGNVMPSYLHDLALSVLAALLRSLFAPHSLVARELPLMNNPANLRAYLVPDLMVVLDAGELDPLYGVLRRQYRVWHEGCVPDLVVEAASQTTVGRDRAGKKDDYALLGVREYVQFDPTGEYLAPRLLVFALDAEGSYWPVEARADGSVPSTVLPYDWLPVGDFLRLRDRATGSLVPTADERAQAAEQRALAAEENAQAVEQRAREAMENAQTAEQRAQEAMENAQAAEQRALAATANAQAVEQRAKEAMETARGAQQRALAAEEQLARLQAELARLGLASLLPSGAQDDQETGRGDRESP